RSRLILAAYVKILPGSRHDYPTRDQVVLTCNVPDHHFLYSLAYDGILIIACTVYAVKTRKRGCLTLVLDCKGVVKDILQIWRIFTDPDHLVVHLNFDVSKRCPGLYIFAKAVDNTL
ncbi:hypothetical protein ANCDUO_24391, partial [Ancylostoma duodenale]